MKKISKIHYIFIFLLVLITLNVYSQSDCGTEDFPGGQAPYEFDYFGGFLKPQRTDFSNGSPSDENANFNMLFVFIEFADEINEDDNWPIGEEPGFMNKFLVKDKVLSGDYWNRYRDSSLSDYYIEVTQGTFHVNGEARHIITDHTWGYYDSLNFSYEILLTEIYNKLKSDTSISWTKFDQWSRNDQSDNFVNVKDNYLDMMGLFFRNVYGNDFLNTASGVAGQVPLNGPDNFILFANSTDTVRVGSGRNKFGSGFTAKGNLGVISYNRAMGIAIHEYGHYLFASNH